MVKNVFQSVSREFSIKLILPWQLNLPAMSKLHYSATTYVPSSIGTSSPLVFTKDVLKKLDLRVLPTNLRKECVVRTKRRGSAPHLQMCFMQTKRAPMSHRPFPCIRKRTVSETRISFWRWGIIEKNRSIGYADSLIPPPLDCAAVFVGRTREIMPSVPWEKRGRAWASGTPWVSHVDFLEGSEIINLRFSMWNILMCVRGLGTLVGP